MALKYGVSSATTRSGSSRRRGIASLHVRARWWCRTYPLDRGKRVCAHITLSGWGVKSPVSVHVSVTAGDDDDVAIVGGQSWADRDRELRKRAIDIDDGDVQQETEHGQKRHRSRTPARISIMGPLRQHNEDNEIDDGRDADDV